MNITEKQLRTLVKETLLKEQSVYSQRQQLLKNEYEQTSNKTRYPYGRHRGDVRSNSVWVRKDGQPIPEEDLAVFKAVELEQRKDPYASMGGIHTHALSDDGLSLNVTYYRHTAG